MSGRPTTPPVDDDLAHYPRKFIAPIQLARYLSISRRTIYHHIQKGALRVRKIEGTIRIPIDEARRYASE
jgi:excisionase family DNA binding protein